MRGLRWIAVAMVILLWATMGVLAQGLPPRADLTGRINACLMERRTDGTTRSLWTIITTNAGDTSAGPSETFFYTNSGFARVYGVPALAPGQEHVQQFVVVGGDLVNGGAQVNRTGAVPEWNTANNYPSAIYRTQYYSGSGWWVSGVPYFSWCPGYAPRAYGIVFQDKNRNGRQDAGEPGLRGVIVQLWQGSRLVTSTTSGFDGRWSMTVATGGRYSLVAIVPRTLGLGTVSWTTPSRYYNIPLTGGARGPYRFGISTLPPPPPAKKPISPRPEVNLGWGTAVTHPIVVGQDPDRRGADVFVTIRAYPVTYIWYELNPTTGRWIEKRAAVTDYVDLNSIRLTATLTAASRAWIRNELAAKYPGARVRRPFWNLRAQPTYRVVRNRVLADGTNEVVLAVTRIPFEDPGVYTVRVSARTRGTSWPGSSARDVQPPAATRTPGQRIAANAPLRVYLLDATIVK